MKEVGRTTPWDHDRTTFRLWCCLEIKVHKASRKGCKAMSAVLWNSANLVDMREDDLDVTEAILLDDTMAILYVGWCSSGKGLT